MSDPDRITDEDIVKADAFISGLLGMPKPEYVLLRVACGCGATNIQYDKNMSRLISTPNLCLNCLQVPECTITEPMAESANVPRETPTIDNSDHLP